MSILFYGPIFFILGWLACDLFDEDRAAAWAWVKAKWAGFFSKAPK